MRPVRGSLLRRLRMTPRRRLRVCDRSSVGLVRTVIGHLGSNTGQLGFRLPPLLTWRRLPSRGPGECTARRRLDREPGAWRCDVFERCIPRPSQLQRWAWCTGPRSMQLCGRCALRDRGATSDEPRKGEHPGCESAAKRPARRSFVTVATGHCGRARDRSIKSRGGQGMIGR